MRHFPNGTLAVVCDGMGGHDCGFQAAEIASKSFTEFFEWSEGGSMAGLMLKALEKANAAVGDFFAKRALYGGCTLLAVYISGGVMWWVSVGDSPLLLWRRGRLVRLNADHSLRAMYEQFLRNSEEVADVAISQAHSLRSAVTGAKIPLIDNPVTPYLLLPGDRVVLASDGVDELLLGKPLSEAAQKALDAPLDRLSAEIVQGCRELELPDADNVTVLSMEYVPSNKK